VGGHRHTSGLVAHIGRWERGELIYTAKYQLEYGIVSFKGDGQLVETEID
jgi:hypothetical protein